MQYAVSDAITGDITVQEVPFSEDTLDSDEVFLIDCVNHLYVWIGSGATAQEKEQSMIIAEEFLKELERSGTTSMTRIKQGQEYKYQCFLDELQTWEAESGNGY